MRNETENQNSKTNGSLVWVVIQNAHHLIKQNKEFEADVNKTGISTIRLKLIYLIVSNQKCLTILICILIHVVADLFL